MTERKKAFAANDCKKVGHLILTKLWFMLTGFKKNLTFYRIRYDFHHV